MTNLIHIAHLISAAWAAAGEIITATAILAALNTAANAIRWTYRAGAATGRLLWPVIHWTIGIIRQIDWHYAMTVALECAVAVVVICWMAAQWSHRALITTSAVLGHWYAALITAGVGPAPQSPQATWLFQSSSSIKKTGLAIQAGGATAARGMKCGISHRKLGKKAAGGMATKLKLLVPPLNGTQSIARG